MSNGPQFWGNTAQWVSALGTAGALFLGLWALRRQRRIGRALEFERGYKTQRKHLETFWRLLRNEYERFKTTDASAPAELEELLRRSGLPPNLVQSDRDIRDWRHDNEKYLNSDQAKLFRFVSRIYPQKDGRAGAVWQHSSIKPESDARAFHHARGEVATFWDTEAWAVPPDHLRLHQADAAELLIALCWLEIGLQAFTQARGPGKLRLFREARTMLQ